MEGLAHGRAFQGSLKYVCQEIEKVDAGSWHSRVDLGEPGGFILVFSHRESRATVICHIPRRHDQTQQWSRLRHRKEEVGSGDCLLVLVRLTPKRKRRKKSKARNPKRKTPKRLTIRYKSARRMPMKATARPTPFPTF